MINKKKNLVTHHKWMGGGSDGTSQTRPRYRPYTRLRRPCKEPCLAPHIRNGQRSPVQALAQVPRISICNCRPVRPLRFKPIFLIDIVILPWNFLISAILENTVRVIIGGSMLLFQDVFCFKTKQSELREVVIYICISPPPLGRGLIDSFISLFLPLAN